MHALLIEKGGDKGQFWKGQQVLKISQKQREQNHFHIEAYIIYIDEVSDQLRRS